LYIVIQNCNVIFKISFLNSNPVNVLTSQQKQANAGKVINAPKSEKMKFHKITRYKTV